MTVTICDVCHESEREVTGIRYVAGRDLCRDCRRDLAEGGRKSVCCAECRAGEDAHWNKNCIGCKEDVPECGMTVKTFGSLCHLCLHVYEVSEMPAKFIDRADCPICAASVDICRESVLRNICARLTPAKAAA